MESVKNEKDEIIYQLAEDVYNSLIAGLNMYKYKYEQAEKLLQDEKENVVDLLMKVEALEDRIKELEKNLQK